MKRSIILLCAALTAACAGGQQDGQTLSGLKRSDFQSEADGKKTDLFVLKNDKGMEVCVTNFGGRIVSVMVPDRDGVMRDVVLGFDNIGDYRDDSRLTSGLRSAAMPTASGRGGSHWTAPNTSCRRITTVTVCTEVPGDFSTGFSTPCRRATARWS